MRQNLYPLVTCLKLASALSILLICGCASVGPDFKYQNRTSLEIGQTPASDYKQTFGKPHSVTVKQTADGKFELVRYLHAYADMGTARTRLLDLEFRDGVLNSYNYLSSFDQDKTVAELDRLSNLERKKSTKDDVLKVLGTPHGKSRCPSCSADFKDRCGKGNEVWAWTMMGKLSTFGAAYGGVRPQVQTVFVAFDKDGVVSDFESAVSNQ